MARQRDPEGAASSLPVLDLSDFKWASATDRADIAGRLDGACQSTGSFILSGHGIATDLISSALDLTREFFRRPDPFKRQFASVTGSPYRGWRSKQVSGSTDVRLREDFEVSRYDSVEALADAGYGPEWAAWVEPNRWPPRPLGFRRTWTTLWAALEQLGDGLLELMATGLGLPPRWFTGRFDRQVSYLAAHHYPPQLAAGRERILRMGSHTGLGTMSILCQHDANGGLEVGSRSGDWAPVTTDASGLVVCVGELFAQWSGDRWFAAPQRVRSPSDRDPALSRTSVTFYQYPNLDTVIDPNALGASSQPGAGIVAGQWSHERMQQDLDL